MPARRTALVVAALLLGTAGTAAAIYTRINGGDPERDGTEATLSELASGAAGAFSTDVAIPVQGAPVERGTLVLSVAAAGQAEAWQRAVVVAQVNGRVVGLPVREGDAIGSGQLLVALDGAEYGLTVEEAEAALRDAQGKFQEATLFDDRIEDADLRRDREAAARVRSGVEAAEVRLRRARLDLERTRLAAPFGGRVASLKVVPGQWVRQGEELVTVVSLDPIRVEVQVLESEVAHLAPGRSADVTFAAFPGERFAGRVQSINPIVESGTRTARVTVLVPNPEGRVLPGMYARVSLEARRFDDRVIVPRSAILERDRRTMLFVYDPAGSDGVAKWRYVTVGLQNESQAEILTRGVDTDSVTAGEIVLTDGHYTLIHDARVRLVESPQAAGGRPD